MDQFDGSTEAGATGSTWATTQPLGNGAKHPSRAFAPARKLSSPCKSFSARLVMVSSPTALAKRSVRSSISGYSSRETIYDLRRSTATTSLPSESRLASGRRRSKRSRRYEAGTSTPTLDVLKNIALALHTSADTLVFDPDERDPQDDLKLIFEAINDLDPHHQQLAKELLEAITHRAHAHRWQQPTAS